MKLYLGCGRVYLDWYINIDYPLNKHTADKYWVDDKNTRFYKFRGEPNV